MHNPWKPFVRDEQEAPAKALVAALMSAVSRVLEPVPRLSPVPLRMTRLSDGTGSDAWVQEDAPCVMLCCGRVARLLVLRGQSLRNSTQTHLGGSPRLREHVQLSSAPQCVSAVQLQRHILAMVCCVVSGGDIFSQPMGRT